MKFGMRCAVVAVLGVAMVICASSSMTAANADDITIKTVMKKVNGKGGLKSAIDADLKAKEPKWDDLASKTKELLPLAKAMPGDKPPKGDDDSWKKLAGGYAKAAEDLDKAVAAKDATAATAAFKVLTACAPCHMAHRPAK